MAPVHGGKLRAQFGTQQAFAGFLQVNNEKVEEKDDFVPIQFRGGFEQGDILPEGRSVNISGQHVQQDNQPPTTKNICGRIVAIGDSSLVDTSTFAHNSIYGSFKLMELFVNFLVEGSVALTKTEMFWSTFPELLLRDHKDSRLSAPFSSFNPISDEKLNRDRILRQREFLRYSQLYDHKDELLPLSDFCLAF